MGGEAGDGRGREGGRWILLCSRVRVARINIPVIPRGGKEILHSQGIWNNELQTEPDFNKSRSAESKGVAKIIHPFKIKKECHGQKEKINNGGKEGRE